MLENIGMREQAKGNKVRTGDLMPIVLSLLFAAAALFVILWTGYPDAQEKWAFGVIGTILGYWLKR